MVAQNVTPYEAYALLDAEIKQLEDRKEELRIEILQEMISTGEEKVDTAVGKFSVMRLKKWTYPENVLEIGDKFKAAKAKAESTGDATCEESQALRFTQVKI